MAEARLLSIQVLDSGLMKLRAVKGTFDILPENQTEWRTVYAAAERVLSSAGVQEITPPVFEYTDVFSKSVGASSDLVVQKEMYTFTDRGERSLTLRPEFTAGVLRAFIDNGLYNRRSPVKLWSKGPVFRAENVQRGRFRQFHQVNCEFLGLDTPLIDAEAIALLYAVLQACGLKGLSVKLGSVGDPEDRGRYNDYLRDELSAADLSETSQERLRLNPLRILDSKDAGDQEVIRGLKRPLDFLNSEAKAHFEAVKAYLEAWEIPLEIDDSIVRGLDYYRRTAFEIHHGSIGAQSALCGGGRYDGLVESLGGPKTPGIGWAFGTERVLDAMREDGVTFPDAPRPALFLVPMDDEAVAEVARTALNLRPTFWVEHAYTKRNPGKGLKEADRAGATYAALRGSKERQDGVYGLKHLSSGEQTQVAEDELGDFLTAHTRLET